MEPPEETSMKRREKATDLDRDRPKTPRTPYLLGAVAANVAVSLAAASLATALVAGALFGAVVLAGPSAAAQETAPRYATRGGPEATVRTPARGVEVFAGRGCARVESAAGSVTAGDCPRRTTDARDRSTQDRDASWAATQPAQEGVPPDGGAERPAPSDEAGEGCASEGPKGETVAATVKGTTDGDTLEISKRIRGTTTVRLIGVDTPETVDPDEPVEPFGRETSAYTKDALDGRRVRLEIGQDPKDDYGRLLAYLWTEDGMFEEDLLARGYGRLMIVEPNDAYEGCLTAAEHAAKDEELGLWADGAGRAPKEHEDPPETTGEDGSPTPSAPPAPRTTPTPDANEEPGDGGGLLETFFGGGPDEQSERRAETTLADDDSTDAASQQPTTPAALQYAGPGSGRPPARGPEVRDLEIQDPEVQDQEVQEPEIQDAVSPGPAVSPVASPSASPSALPSASLSASPSASPAPEISLPETGGPSVFRPVLGAIGLASGLLVAAMRVRGHNATPGDGE
jgi:micrococcal nuclease